MDLFDRSVGSHPERINNLYFTYIFLLRALAKAAPILKSYDYATGHAEVSVHYCVKPPNVAFYILIYEFTTYVPW